MLFGYHWDLSSNWAFAISILPILLHGMLVTIEATLLGFFIAAVLGLVFAVLRGSPTRLISYPVYRRILS